MFTTSSCYILCKGVAYILRGHSVVSVVLTSHFTQGLSIDALQLRYEECQRERNTYPTFSLLLFELSQARPRFSTYFGNLSTFSLSLGPSPAKSDFPHEDSVTVLSQFLSTCISAQLLQIAPKQLLSHRECLRPLLFPPSPTKQDSSLGEK